MGVDEVELLVKLALARLLVLISVSVPISVLSLLLPMPLPPFTSSSDVVETADDIWRLCELSDEGVAKEF